jgi:hypothetical protein
VALVATITEQLRELSAGRIATQQREDAEHDSSVAAMNAEIAALLSEVASATTSDLIVAMFALTIGGDGDSDARMSQLAAEIDARIPPRQQKRVDDR